jgi:hypothetical protein
MKYILALFTLTLFTAALQGGIIDYTLEANVDGTFDGTPFSGHEVVLSMTVDTATSSYLNDGEFAYYNVGTLNLSILGDTVNINTNFIDNDYTVFAYQGSESRVGFGALLDGPVISPIMDVKFSTGNMWINNPFRVEGQWANLDTQQWATMDGGFSIDTPNGYNNLPVWDGVSVPEPNTCALIIISALGAAFLWASGVRHRLGWSMKVTDLILPAIFVLIIIIAALSGNIS